MYTEEQILEVVNGKDKMLYKRLYETYYAALCRYATKLLKNVASEEDVVQEVLVKFYETDTCFQNVRAVTAYLYRAVYNVCLNLLRDKKEFANTEWTNVIYRYAFFSTSPN